MMKQAGLAREFIRRLAASSVAYPAMDERTSRPAVVVAASETFGFSRFQVYRIIQSLVRAGVDVERVRSARTVFIIYLDGAADTVFPDRLATRLRRRAYIAPYTVDQHIHWILGDATPDNAAETNTHIVNKINDVLNESGRLAGSAVVWPCAAASGVMADVWALWAAAESAETGKTGVALDRPISRSFLVINNKIIKAFERLSLRIIALKNKDSKIITKEKLEKRLTALVSFRGFRKKAKTDRLVEYQGDVSQKSQIPADSVRSGVVDAIDEFRRLAAIPQPTPDTDGRAYLRHPFVQVWAAAFRMKPWHLRQPWRTVLGAMPTDRKSVARWTQAVDHLRAAHGLQNPWRIGLMLEVYAGACPVCAAIEKRRAMANGRK